MTARVETGGRLHVGFLNLSLARERLYGSLGVALDQPRVVVEADPRSGDPSVGNGGVCSLGDPSVGDGGDGGSGDGDRTPVVVCDHDRARGHAERACNLLGVPGVEVRVHDELPVHTGLGSGTQLALAVLAAVARAHGDDPLVRERAPDLGRGGRSGVGVAAFEAGGFVLDAGHPTARFTTARPARGEWTVPPVAARHDVPDDWRFVLVLPDADPGKAGDDEDASMRAAVESADPRLADRIAGAVTRRVLPAVATGDVDEFGAAVADVGRLNGAWYTDEQGGVYRPPAGEIVAELADAPAIAGASQSSWGPAVFGVTDAERADAAADAGRRALDAAGVDGEVRVVEARNRGARIED